MKITIAYQTEEAQQAGAILAMARHLLGKVKVRHADKHEPFRHIYITKENPATVAAQKGP